MKAETGAPQQYTIVTLHPLCCSGKADQQPGPSIARSTSENSELVLKSVNVTTPDGSRQLCKVSVSDRAGVSVL